MLCPLYGRIECFAPFKVVAMFISARVQGDTRESTLLRRYTDRE